MSNEQLRTIAVNRHAQVVSGPHKGTVGIVVVADWEAKKVSLEDENAPFDDNIVCAWHEVEQEGSEPVEVPAQPAPMTAEQMAEIAGALSDEQLGIFGAIGCGKLLLAEVQRWKDQARKEYELSCKLQDEARERETALTAEVQRLQGTERLWKQVGWEIKARKAQEQLGEAVEELEWYGDVTEEEDSVYYCQPRGYGVMPSKVQVDGGQRALDFLKKLKGDRTDG